MPYLSIGGVTVRVAVESVSLRYVNAGGDEERSPAGSLEGGPLVLKREWAMATTPVLASEVAAWVGLIEGRGHSWPFDADLYSARGRGPTSSTGAALITSGMKYGAGYLLTAAAGSVSYSAGLTSAWTILLWRKESGTWIHYVFRSDGEFWTNGVQGGVVDPVDVISVLGGLFLFGDIGGGGLRDFDDVVALPYSVPDTWPPLMYARHNTAAWSALPRLSAAGTFSSDAVTVRGKVTDTRVIRYSPSGTVTNGHTIQFTLREV